MAKKKPVSVDQLGLFDLPSRPPGPRPSQPSLPMDLGPITPPPPTPPSEVKWAPRRLEGVLELTDALRLECNLALMAGAGTGKTYSLITLCLHLFAGARHAGSGPLEPARLCMVTFTDKAASEMRSRLRKRIDGLVYGEREPELLASYEALGQPPHPPKFWRRIRDGLGAASIGTFHGLCVQLLKQAPAGSGVNPAFDLLDERTASELLRDTVERTVIAALEAGDERVVDLCREYDFSGGRAGGLVGWLVRTWSRIREEGLDPEWVKVGLEPQARDAFDQQLAESRAELARVNRTKFEARHVEHFDRIRRALDGMSLETVDLEERLDSLDRALKKLLIDAVKPFKALARKLPAFYGAWRVAPYEQTVKLLLGQVKAAYQRALEKKNALDFTGLLVSARDLLRDHPDFRREVQQRFGALLVDEFQDTNRLQLELVMLLSEERSGPPTALTRSFAADVGDEIVGLKLEPAFLCAVGDRKQSIYEFRGADVSVFEQLARRIRDEGGGRAWLTQSRRSTPELVEFFNGAFPRVMPVPGPTEAPASPWEVSFAEEDRLTAHRGSAGAHAPVLQLITHADTTGFDVAAWRELDAAAIARTVAWLLRGSGRLVQPRQGPARPIRGGDIALLLRRFTQVEHYRQALAKEGVCHRVVRGRGFFGAQEVVDLASMLGVVADPSDAVSLAAVLRSPLVGLTDGALLGLGAGGLDAKKVLEGRVETPLLAPFERERLDHFRGVWARLRKERDRLGLRALLRVALEETGYRTAIAASPFGEQALANLEKLLELAGQRDARGVGCASFAQELLTLADTVPLESQGEVIDEGDGDAVTLCTVHQAKGLEWPVVALPELFVKFPGDSDALRFDRGHGLSLRPPEADSGQLVSERHQRLGTERESRSKAESKRLFYVALTRARDQVVLGLTPPGAPSFATYARAAITPPTLDPNQPALNPHVENVDASALLVPPAAGLPPTPADAEAQVAQLVARVLEGPAPQPRQAALPVTQLQDFVLCPRRYRFAHLVGLAERPIAFHWSGETDDDEAPSVDPKTRGIAAHKLLELTPLEDVGTPRLRARLEELVRTEALLPLPGVIDWVERFWATDFGKGLKAAGAARVHRELPFVLRLDDGHGFSLMLRGQIDLLVEGADGIARVVDYKTSQRPAEGLAPYEFQLGCYALAAAKFVQPGVRVLTGISFLREVDSNPLFQSAPPGLEATLAGHARALVQAQLDGQWRGHERGRCEALGCGYVYRCHPDENRL